MMLVWLGSLNLHQCKLKLQLKIKFLSIGNSKIVCYASHVLCCAYNHFQKTIKNSLFPTKCTLIDEKACKLQFSHSFPSPCQSWCLSFLMQSWNSDNCGNREGVGDGGRGTREAVIWNVPQLLILPRLHGMSLYINSRQVVRDDYKVLRTCI